MRYGTPVVVRDVRVLGDAEIASAEPLPGGGVRFAIEEGEHALYPEAVLAVYVPAGGDVGLPAAELLAAGHPTIPHAVGSAGTFELAPAGVPKGEYDVVLVPQFAT